MSGGIFDNDGWLGVLLAPSEVHARDVVKHPTMLTEEFTMKNYLALNVNNAEFEQP